MRQEMNNMNSQKIVKSTVVPQYLSEIEKCKQYSLVRSAVEQMMPGKVYRFRKCEERSITAFWKDELWFSNGSTMNDDFDARLYYDKNRIEEWFSTFQDEEGCLKILHQIKNSGKVPIEIEQIIPNWELLIEKLSVMNKEESKAISIQFIKYVRDALDSSLQDITQHSYVIAKPSAIYLGRKISKLNQKFLVDIAREKSIPIYKMDFDENTPYYQLKSRQLGE